MRFRAILSCPLQNDKVKSKDFAQSNSGNTDGRLFGFLLFTQRFLLLFGSSRSGAVREGKDVELFEKF